MCVGTDKNGFGFGGTGKKSHAKQFDDYGEVGVVCMYCVCGLDCHTFLIGIREG